MISFSVTNGQLFLGLSNAFYFQVMSWRDFEFVFGLYNDLQWPADKQVIVISSHVLLPIRRPRRDERLFGLDGKARPRVSIRASYDSQCLLRMRLTRLRVCIPLCFIVSIDWPILKGVRMFFTRIWTEFKVRSHIFKWKYSRNLSIQIWVFEYSRNRGFRMHSS